jgi:hypothetical protein
MAATALVRGQLDSRWQSVTGAVQGIALIVALSVVSGVALAGLGAFFDWLGWGSEPQKKPVSNPIVRAVLLPILLFGAALLLWTLGVR